MGIVVGTISVMDKEAVSVVRFGAVKGVRTGPVNTLSNVNYLCRNLNGQNLSEVITLYGLKVFSDQ